MIEQALTTLLKLLAQTGSPSARLKLAVVALGAVSFTTLVVNQGWGSLPLLPVLGFAIASSLMSSFPYKVSGRASYFLDFHEILLVVALPYLGPGPIVLVLSTGSIVGSIVRGTTIDKLMFNAGVRASSASLALASVALLPATVVGPDGYLLSGALAGLVFAIVGATLVIRMVSLADERPYWPELLRGLRVDFLRIWPLVVGYGLLTGLASMVTPFALILAAVPVVLMVSASRRTQGRRDEYRRLSGLYSAAQRMHDACCSDDVLANLQDSISETLGVEGAVLRSAPPFGDELGALLHNRKQWLVLPASATSATCKQDEAFLQALASLADTGLERAMVMDELERQSLRDPLTNAFNRRYFLQALAGVVGETDQQPGCLALIDIDHFKAINDTFGHEAGDDALRKLVSLVESRFRSDDQLCRIGGDEFALLLPGLEAGSALERLEGLRRELESLSLGAGATSGGALTGDSPVRAFRASIGVAVYPLHSRDPKALLAMADQALYRAKREGRNRVVVASPVPDSTDYEHDDEVVGHRYGEEVAVDSV